MGLLSIVIDVQLGKNRSLAFWRQQRANSVNDLTMKPKRIGTTTLPIERVIQLSPHRSHGQRIVVVANVLAKLLCRRFLRSEEPVELNGRGLNGREKDLALIATHAKPGAKNGRLGKALIQPMKGTTIWAANIEVAKVVNLPSRIKGTTCQWKCKWSLWRLGPERGSQHLILEDHTKIYTYIVRGIQIKNKTSPGRG